MILLWLRAREHRRALATPCGRELRPGQTRVAGLERLVAIQATVQQELPPTRRLQLVNNQHLLPLRLQPLQALLTTPPTSTSITMPLLRVGLCVLSKVSTGTTLVSMHPILSIQQPTHPTAGPRSSIVLKPSLPRPPQRSKSQSTWTSATNTF